MLAATGARASVLGLGAPRRGGTLRLGLSGWGAGDGWDPRRPMGAAMRVLGHGAVFDCLTEVAADGALVGELATRWEASADARIWTFDLRRDVRFHDGAAFGAEDVAATLAAHGPTSPARGLVAQIAAMRCLGPHRIEVTLAAPNPDLPFLLADPHLAILPAGRLEEAAARGIGTGLYRVARWEAGRVATLARVEAHWKDGTAGWFDAVEATALADPAARIAALRAGRVDAIDDVPPRSAARLRGQGGASLSQVTGNRHLALRVPASGGVERAAIRTALAHALDRAALLRGALRGHGAVAADHPIGPANPYFAADIAAPAHDPDRARAVLRAAGLSEARLRAKVCDTVHPAAIALAEGVAEAAAAIGVRIDLVRGAGGGAIAAPAGRPTEDWAFATAPHRLDGPVAQRLDALVAAGRVELDGTARGAIYARAQRLLAEEGSILVPLRADWLDGYKASLAHGTAVGNLWALDSGRIAERWWMA
ncbi:MAG: ABC transporter substrate-binding protein [Shimia sp.]